MVIPSAFGDFLIIYASELPWHIIQIGGLGQRFILEFLFAPRGQRHRPLVGDGIMGFAALHRSKIKLEAGHIQAKQKPEQRN